MSNGCSGSLMKRTKAELVNIILRKDEVETSANGKISALESQVKNLQSELELITDLKLKAEAECSDYRKKVTIANCNALMIKELTKKIRFYRIVSTILFIIAAVAIVMLF